MALIEKQEYQSEVLPISSYHQVQVRVSNLIVDDKTEEIKAVSYHRYVLAPDADLDDQPAEVKRVANAAWTKSVRDKYAAHLAEQAEASPAE